MAVDVTPSKKEEEEEARGTKRIKETRQSRGGGGGERVTGVSFVEGVVYPRKKNFPGVAEGGGGYDVEINFGFSTQALRDAPVGESRAFISRDVVEFEGRKNSTFICSSFALVLWDRTLKCGLVETLGPRTAGCNQTKR